MSILFNGFSPNHLPGPTGPVGPLLSELLAPKHLYLIFYAACFIFDLISRKYLRNSSIATKVPSRFSADQ